jgi:hypothetical protein
MGKGFKSFVFDCSDLPEGMRKTGEEFDRSVMRTLERRGAKRDDAFLIMFVDAAGKCWLVLRRAAGLLFSFWQANACEGAMDPAKKAREAELTEGLSKAHEQWRRAMKDLREYVEKTYTRCEIALADLMKPVLKKAAGVLEDALECETRKDGRESGSDENAEAES